MFRKLVIQLSNCAPRKLNVFLKSLEAKLDIMRSELSQAGGAVNRTPLAVARFVFCGVAACQLGGVTLHSFAGIGVGRGSAEDCLTLALSKENVVKQWKLCTHLIVDEISMVDADFFTKIEYGVLFSVARHIRGDNRPFGGVKLIVTGDFLQLPPVCGKDEAAKFCFESEAWNRCIKKTVMLERVHRQDDSRFVKVLQEIRVGKCGDDVYTALTETKANNFSAEGIVPTRLCTHTADALAVNTHSLEELEGKHCKIFEAEDSQFIPESLRGTVAKRLVLKVNAQVMLMKNIDLSRGLSNGSRGVVTKFSKKGFPMVKFFSTDGEIEVVPIRFAVRLPGCNEPACRRQLPLQLAWAISIHKSQGLTLDAVEVSLERVFAEGQSYVALSRARSLASLRVIAFDPSAIRANKNVIRYYESIKETAAEEAEEEFIFRKRRKLSAEF
ncbi:unnamed protein product [Heligmosomoides polygyrus]|uniref:ATP-dependent DNA helicase n=1 Tax=Heligmosomoides polygyrus TaxID=6339 RepID=A0A3P8INU2_HELPZ|nr:unnamed protein product [Heligmosomoides polygyrus]